jgi:aspartyl-tRNA(Asn)/glutamyl-tRNA(Gln) amidotransferase subunit A
VSAVQTLQPARSDSFSDRAFDNYFLAAQRLRNELKNDVDKIMRIPNPLRYSQVDDFGVDLLLFPSAISHAPTREDVSSSKGKSTDSYVQDILTVPASLAGLPALSYPVHIEGMLPVGVQLVSQWGSDNLVLEVASQLEDVVIASPTAAS